MYTWHLVNCNISHKSQARNRNSCKDSFRYSKLVFDSTVLKQFCASEGGWWTENCFVKRWSGWCSEFTLLFAVSWKEIIVSLFCEGKKLRNGLLNNQANSPLLFGKIAKASFTSVSRTTLLGAGVKYGSWNLDPLFKKLLTEYEISTTPPSSAFSRTKHSNNFSPPN